jgi:hypothetical protein
MSLRYILVLSFLLGFPAGLGRPAAAQDAAAPAEAGASTASTSPESIPAVGPVQAADVTIEQFLWDRRPIVIFADTPNDPLLRRQMGWIEADLAALDERDVVVIVDTAPETRSAVRQRLRPRGFSLVLMDKDGEVKMRKPQPQTVREITRTIDRFPLRRQEMLERRPSGR